MIPGGPYISELHIKLLRGGRAAAVPEDYIDIWGRPKTRADGLYKGVPQL